MDKSAAKALKKGLKKNSNTQFAFAPNSGDPLFLIGRVPWTVARVKKKAEPEAGVLYKNGALYIGEITRDGTTLTLRVDTDASKGNISIKKALLGFRKLRKELTTLGEVSPLLKSAIWELGGQSEQDSGSDEGEGEQDIGLDDGDEIDLTAQFNYWRDRIATIEDRERNLSAGNFPEDRDPEELKARLSKATRKVHEELKLVYDQVDGDFGDHTDEYADYRRRVDALLSLLDASRAAKHGEWGDDYAPIAPIEVPADLPRVANDWADELNDLLTGGGRSAKELADGAYAIAQRCLEMRRSLKGPFWKKKKRNKQIAALVELQHKATAAADAALVEGAMHERGEEIMALLESGNVDRTALGGNGAQFIRTDDDEIRFIAKFAKMDNPAQIIEMKQEIASGAVSELLSIQLGMPRMVSRTTGAVVEWEDEPQLMAVQDAWDAQGDFGDASYHLVEALDKTFKVRFGEALLILTEKDSDQVLQHKLLAKHDLELSEENTQILFAAIDGKDWMSCEYAAPEVDPDLLAQDMADMCCIDLILGQRDHPSGKEDNVLIVQEGGVNRVKPIDFGMALMDPEVDAQYFNDFGTWSDEGAAAVSFDEERIERLLALDPSLLAQTARRSLEHLQTTTNVEESGPHEASLIKLEVNTRMIQLALTAAIEKDVEVCPRDLAAMMEVEGKEVITNLGATWAVRNPDVEGWRDNDVEEILAQFTDSLGDWVDEISVVKDARIALDQAFSACYAAVIAVENGEEVEDLEELFAAVESAIEEMDRVATRDPDQRAFGLIAGRLPRLRARVGLD